MSKFTGAGLKIATALGVCTAVSWVYGLMADYALSDGVKGVSAKAGAWMILAFLVLGTSVALLLRRRCPVAAGSFWGWATRRGWKGSINSIRSRLTKTR